jgi:hypothetical protein
MGRRVMIALRCRRNTLIVLMGSRRNGIVSHRFVIVFTLCSSRCRRTGDHRRGSEAL